MRIFKNLRGTQGPGTQERVKLAYQAKQPRFSVFIQETVYFRPKNSHVENTVS